MNNSKERERGERDLGVEDEMKMKSKHIRVWNGIKGLFKVVALEAKKKKRSRFAISAAALQSRGAFAKVATHDTTGTESITMPCESQPGWYCLERVMRYRLNRQLIPGQIASVIQNKHGWHASLKGWTVQSRGPVIRTETTGPEIHFAQYRRGDARSGIHWSGCFILEEWDFVGIIYNLQVSHEYFSQHIFFFSFPNVYSSFCEGVSSFTPLENGERTNTFTTAARAFDMEMSGYWFWWSDHWRCGFTSSSLVCCLSCCGHWADGLNWPSALSVSMRGKRREDRKKGRIM